MVLKRLRRGMGIGLLMAVPAGIAAIILWGSWQDIQDLRAETGDTIDPSTVPYLLIALALFVGINVLVCLSTSRVSHSIAPIRSFENDDIAWEEEVVWPRKGPKVSPKW